MKNITVNDILRECNGELICGDITTICEDFSIDTRKIKKNDIYVGIKGINVNGGDFYKEALEKGAKGCIIQDTQIDNNVLNQYKNIFVIKVKNTIEALQKIATYKRSLYDIPVICITGSVGKTSTKDIVASVLSKKYNVLKTEGNHNNEIGLPLTILKLKNHNCMVLEAGMSALGEIRELVKIAKPTTAAITMIGSSHIGELGSRENILKAKLEILEYLDKNGAIAFNNDNDMLHEWELNNNDSHRHITYGIENKSQVMAENIVLNEKSSEFDVKVNNNYYTFKIPVAGKHFVYNALCAISIGLEYDIKIEDIKNGIEEFDLTKKRMEIITNKNNVKIINDCYNASYESVKAALEYMRTVEAKNKIAVLGDILELGEYSKEMHQKVGDEVVKNKIDVLITVGKEAENIADRCIELGMEKEKIYILKDNNEAIKILRNTIKEGDVVLVKASNGMHFDEIVNNL